MFILHLRRLQDLLATQYSTYVCIRWRDIILAGTATLPAPIPPLSPASSGPSCLACNWSFWSEWLRLSSLGPAPAHSYRMCMLDVFLRWTRVVQPRQNSTDSLFHHFPEHYRHSTFPSTAQPGPPPHQTKHVRYYCTSLPERAKVAAPFFFFCNDFLKLVLCLSALPGLLLIRVSHHCTW